MGDSRGAPRLNPLEGMKKPAARPPRSRVLSDEELSTALAWPCQGPAAFGDRAEYHPPLPADRSARRRGSGIQPAELDAKKRTWTIPARVKERRANTVPLTDAAFDLAKKIAAGPKLSSHAVAQTIRLAQERFGIEQWTLHDLRRTAVTRHGRARRPAHRARHIINHISVHQGRRHARRFTQQYDYSKEKREALELWADGLAGIVAGAASVVPIRA